MSASARLLQIAARIDQLLVEQIDQGIDLARLVQEPRYARDVLLVCDACRGTELPQLAAEFRRLSARSDEAPPGGHARQPTEWSNTSTGFGVTGFDASRPVDSLSAGETPAAPTPRADERSPARRWWTRWLKP